MTRSERLLAILQVLRGRRLPMTAASLAERFGVSERTIYRDVATLTAQGAVIQGGAGFGYALREDYFLPPLSLDPEEAAALMLGLRFVERRGDRDLALAASSAKGKLEAVSPATLGPGARLESPLLVAPSPRQDQGKLLAVRDALGRERKMRIGYADAGGRETIRVIWPVALGFFDECEIVAAWCEAREAFRHFRLDRIAWAKVLDVRPDRARRRLLAEYRAMEPGITI